MSFALTEWTLAIEAMSNLLEETSTSLKIDIKTDFIENSKMVTVLSSNNGRECHFENDIEEETENPDLFSGNNRMIIQCKGSSTSSTFSNIVLNDLGDVGDFIIFHLQTNFLFIRQLTYLTECISIPSLEFKLFDIKIIDPGRNMQTFFQISNGEDRVIRLSLKKGQSQTNPELHNEFWILEYTNKSGQTSNIELESYPRDLLWEKDNLFLECAWLETASKHNGAEEERDLYSHPTTSKNMKIVLYLLGLNIPKLTPYFLK